MTTKATPNSRHAELGSDRGYRRLSPTSIEEFGIFGCHECDRVLSINATTFLRLPRNKYPAGAIRFDQTPDEADVAESRGGIAVCYDCKQRIDDEDAAYERCAALAEELDVDFCQDTEDGRRVFVVGTRRLAPGHAFDELEAMKRQRETKPERRSAVDGLALTLTPEERALVLEVYDAGVSAWENLRELGTPDEELELPFLPVPEDVDGAAVAELVGCGVCDLEHQGLSEERIRISPSIGIRVVNKILPVARPGTVVRNPEGTFRRHVPVDEISVPDLWHAADTLRAGGYNTAAELVLEGWHLAHDLLAALRDVGTEEPFTGKISGEPTPEEWEAIEAKRHADTGSGEDVDVDLELRDHYAEKLLELALESSDPFGNGATRSGRSEIDNDLETVGRSDAGRFCELASYVRRGDWQAAAAWIHDVDTTVREAIPLALYDRILTTDREILSRD